MTGGTIIKPAIILAVSLLCLSAGAFLIDPDRHKYMFEILFTLNVAVVLSSSWNILGGLAGQISFGHAGFVGIGAYTVALLNAHLQWSPWTAFLVSGFTAMCGAIVIGSISFTLRGPYFALSTLALAEVMKLIVEGWRSFTYGTQGVVIPHQPLFGITAGSGLYYLVSLWLAGFALLSVIIITRSKTRYLFLAVGENEDAASAGGLNAWQYKMSALLLSSFFAGAAGGLIALHTGFIDPESGFDISRTIEPIFIRIVGGIGTVMGPVIGSVILVPLGEVFRSHFPTAHLLFYGILLVIFARFMPKGIVGLFRRRGR